jgi:phosphatidylinositol-3-phosphatase
VRRKRLVGFAALVLALTMALGLAAAAPQAQFVTTTFATTPHGRALTIPKPSAAAGDVMVAGVEARLRHRGRLTPPAGWTLIRRDRAVGRKGVSLTQALYYRVAGSSEPSGYRWLLRRSAAAIGEIVVYRGVDTSAPILSSSGHASHNVRKIRAPALRHRRSDGILVAFFGHSNRSSTKPPAGLTERADRRGGTRGAPVRLESADGPVARGSKTAVTARTSLAVGQLVALRSSAQGPPPPPPPPPPPSSPCNGATAPAQYDHVVWILFENHSYSSIIGSSSAPYFNQLTNVCGLATNYNAITHPSLPNYIALTSGSTQGITDDGDPNEHPLNVPSIFSQLPAGGSRSLEESMPGNCALGGSGDYVPRHNPETYYTNIRSDCGSYDVPLGSSADLSARFTFITPNVCHDMHDCSVSSGDTWLSNFLPPLLASSQYRGGKTAIFITFDEGSDSNQVATLIVAPPVHAGARSAAAYTHYSLLRTTEEMLGLGLLGNAGSATSMRAGFGL